MNAPLRRLAIVAALLFAALLTSTTYVQFVAAGSLNSRADNVRSFYKEFGQPRGALLVAGQPVAESVPVKDSYGYQRRYPAGPQYAAVTGFYSVVYGTSGMESAAGPTLSGNSNDLFYRRIGDLITGRTPQPPSVQLTINPKAQQAAWDALGDQRGAVVAMDPSTGAVLALVSKPSFDPNRLASHDTKVVKQSWTDLNKDTTRPMDNRAIAGREYAPGSVFKVVTSAAALSSGKYTPDTLLPGPDKLPLPQSTVPLPNDFDGPCTPSGQISLLEALQISCNTAFGSLGMTLGEQALQQQAQAFGFGKPLSIPLRVSESVFPVNLPQSSLAQSAIGQFSVRVTPMQVCMIAAAVANHGVLMKPYLDEATVGSNLEVMSRTQPKKLAEPISSDAAAQLTTMMQAVVENGTGTRAQIPGVKVAGKTGTAQQGPGQPPNAWFTAFAPADNPKVAVAVVVEDGGSLNERATGGQVAAPIAKKVIQAVLGQ
ncbi:MAG TPA: penicillin-binding protein 2 [Kineosporiaceae bacterium]|nr:penicillin-binding protein 2 [Kineosporiaceae bacterium]